LEDNVNVVAKFEKYLSIDAEIERAIKTMLEKHKKMISVVQK